MRKYRASLQRKDMWHHYLSGKSKLQKVLLYNCWDEYIFLKKKVKKSGDDMETLELYLAGGNVKTRKALEK